MNRSLIEAGTAASKRRKPRATKLAIWAELRSGSVEASVTVDLDELFEEEFVLEVGHVKLLAARMRQQLRGLEQAPAVLERVKPSRIGWLILVAGHVQGLACPIVERPGDHRRIQRRVGQVEHAHLLSATGQPPLQAAPFGKAYSARLSGFIS